MPAVFLFTVFAAVDLVLLIRENKYMIQFLLDGSDASRILALDHIADLFRERERFLEMISPSSMIFTVIL